MTNVIKNPCHKSLPQALTCRPFSLIIRAIKYTRPKDNSGPWQSVAATTAHGLVFHGTRGRYLSPDEAFNDPLVRTVDGATVWECNAVTDELDGVIIINPNNAPVFAGRTLRHALWAILERPAFLPYSGKYRIGAILSGRLSEVGFIEADEFDKITAPFKETIQTL